MITLADKTLEDSLLSAAGSASTPVYIDSSGDVAECESLDLSTTGSAASLTDARAIRTNLASTESASFDGTADVTPGVTGTLPLANGGTGATTAAAAWSNLHPANTTRAVNQTTATDAGWRLQMSGSDVLAFIAGIDRTCAGIWDNRLSRWIVRSNGKRANFWGTADSAKWLLPISMDNDSDNAYGYPVGTVYCAQNPSTGAYFYTCNTVVYANLVNAGWTNCGTEFIAADTGCAYR